jgi:hypothetical protein
MAKSIPKISYGYSMVALSAFAATYECLQYFPAMVRVESLVSVPSLAKCFDSMQSDSQRIRADIETTRLGEIQKVRVEMSFAWLRTSGRVQSSAHGSRLEKWSGTR